MASFTEKLTDIFLNASGIKESFDNAYATFLEMAENNEPLPKIAQEVAPHLKPVVSQFTGFWGRKKLQTASFLVNWKLSNVSEDEIEAFLSMAKSTAAKDVSGQSKDVMEVAQKFLDGLSPQRIQDAMDANKGAVTPDMIEDVIVVVKAVKAVLPSKLDSYLHDLIPEIDELEDIIRAEAAEFVKEDSGKQIQTALGKAKEQAENVAKASESVLGTGQNTLIEKLEELETDQIKRILDHVGENMTRAKISNLMVVFFNFAAEVLDAFEDSSVPLRDVEFEHAAAYKDAISEFLQFVEDALDAEGLLPEQLDKAKIQQNIQVLKQVGAKGPKL